MSSMLGLRSESAKEWGTRREAEKEAHRERGTQGKRGETRPPSRQSIAQRRTGYVDAGDGQREAEISLQVAAQSAECAGKAKKKKQIPLETACI